MKKNKLYFSELNDEVAFCRDVILGDTKEAGFTEVKVYEAERETKTNYFFCKAIGEVCVKPPEGEACGSGCQYYEPRNRKGGFCKYFGYCYTPGKELILKMNGKLSKVAEPATSNK